MNFLDPHLSLHGRRLEVIIFDHWPIENDCANLLYLAWKTPIDGEGMSLLQILQDLANVMMALIEIACDNVDSVTNHQ